MVGTVTDPALLAQLNGAQDSSTATPSSNVTDPVLLAQLNGGGGEGGGGGYAHPDTQRHAPESSSSYVADQMKQGVASSIGLLGGGAVSTVNQTLRALHLPHSEHPVGGIEQVTKGWEELLDVKHTKAPTDIYGHVSKNVEYQGEIASFLGGNLLPGLGSVGAAAKGKKLLTAAMEVFSPTMGAATAVEAKEWGRDNAATFGLTPEQGEMVGGMVGGVAGPAALSAGKALAAGKAQAAMKFADSKGLGLSAAGQKAQANGLVAKETSEMLSFAPHSPSNIARANQLMEKIERFDPTLAQKSAAPGLISLAKEIANKSPEGLAQTQAIQAKNLAAIAEHKEKVFGAAPGTVPKEGKLPPDNLTDPAKLALRLQREDVELLQGRNDRELQALSDKYRRTVDNEAVGAELRDKYWELRTQAQAANTNKINGVYRVAKEAGVTVGMQDTREAVQKIIGSDRTTFQNMPPVFAKVLGEYPVATPDSFKRVASTRAGADKPMFTTEVVKGKAGKNEASFEEFHSLYKQANREWADATMAGDSARAGYLQMLRGHLKEKLDVFNGPEYGTLGERFSQFNQGYSKYAERFKQGVGGEIAKRGKNGLARDAEDIVTKTVLQAGDKKAGVKEFFNLYGTDARAAELLHDGLLDNYSKAAMKGGEFDPVAARNWLATHHSAMGELPETAKYFGDAQKAAAAMLNRRVELVAQRKAIDGSVLAKVAGNERPEKLIAAALENPPVMRALMQGANTVESKQAIARSIADHVGKQTQGFEWLKAREKSLQPVMEALGKGHWQNLLDIAEAEGVLSRVKPPDAIELSRIKDPLEAATGTTTSQAISRVRQLGTPLGMSKPVMLATAGMKYFQKYKTEEVWRLRMAAYWNVDIGAALAKQAKNPGPMKGEDLTKLLKTAWMYGVRLETEERRGKEKEESNKQEAARMKENR